MPVGDKQRDARGYICQEADQHLQSAKKNTRGSKDDGTKQSEGINGSKRRPLRAAWTRWQNCASTLQSRQRFNLGADEADTEQESASGDHVAISSYFPGLAGIDAVTGKLTVRNVAYKRPGSR
jgi:hypothetical protein